jgi:RNA polymerase sigma factor (sigma-70 family)
MSGLDDNARFRKVVMPHIDDAYRLAHWLTGNRTDAEDVVQDSLRAFRAIREFAGSSDRAWVLSIVRNTAYSWLRKNRPAAVVTVEDLEAVEAAHAKPSDPDAETPEAELIAKTDAEHLRAAIAALPTPFRETLVLRDIEGLDYREIAETTEVPIGTVVAARPCSPPADCDDRERTMTWRRPHCCPYRSGSLSQRLHRIRGRIAASLPR